MAATKTREERRAHFLWLLEGLGIWRRWKIDGIRCATGEVTQDDLDTLVMPREHFLGAFESSPRAEAFVIRDLEQWYMHAADEVRYMLGHGTEETVREYERFLTIFEKEFVREFFSMSRNGTQAIKAILRAGRLRNGNDAEIVEELLAATGTSLV